MFDNFATSEILARALDVCALRQAVYSSNVANANVEGYRRLEVMFDAQAMRSEAGTARFMTGASSGSATTQPQIVVAANTAVKLDEEMATMARNALQYQTLLGAYDRSMSLLQLAVREGRGA